MTRHNMTSRFQYQTIYIPFKKEAYKLAQKKLIIPSGQLLLLLYLRKMYGTVRFVSDFREQNKTIKRTPFSIYVNEHLLIKS